MYLFLFLFSCLGASEPEAIWLTWQKCPETSMIIHWLTSKEETSDRIEFRQKEAEGWFQAEGEKIAVPDGDPYWIHAINLEGLEPNSLYEFKVDKKSYFFKTAPTHLKQPLTFVVGGDIYHDSVSTFENMNRIVAKQDPLFIVVGGDLAYADRKKNGREDFERWRTWLVSNTQTLVAQDGRLIPLLPVIGNHEVIGSGLQKPSKAKLFYRLFALSEDQGYRSVYFCAGLEFYLLDSNHTHKVSGSQAKWLQEGLKANKEMRYKFAAYHVPAYPAFRSLNKATSREIRCHWSPIFEKNKLTAAFEHHDHLYKRSYPIKNQKVDPTGVLYLGDGAWGVDEPRKARNDAYFEKTASLRHVLFVTLTDQQATVEAIGEDGRVFDTVTR